MAHLLARALARELAKCRTIGEQAWEGNGRFALNLRLDGDAVERADSDLLRVADKASDPARLDRVIRAARGLVADRETVRLLPGRAQLGNLRAWLADTPEGSSEEAFRQRLDAFRDQVRQRRAGNHWRTAFEDLGLIDCLAKACCDNGRCRVEDAELFLSVMVQAKSKQENGTEDDA